MLDRGEQRPDNDIGIAGVIVGLKVAKSKRSGELYAQAALEDTVGKIDLIAFPKDYARLAESLKIDVPVLVRGQLRAEEDAALHTLHELFDRADLPFTGWTIPIERPCGSRLRWA